MGRPDSSFPCPRPHAGYLGLLSREIRGVDVRPWSYVRREARDTIVGQLVVLERDDRAYLRRRLALCVGETGANLESLPGARTADERARAPHVLAFALLVPGDDRFVVVRALDLEQV